MPISEYISQELPGWLLPLDPDRLSDLGSSAIQTSHSLKSGVVVSGIPLGATLVKTAGHRQGQPNQRTVHAESGCFREPRRAVFENRLDPMAVR